MTSFRKSLILASAVSVLGMGVAFAQTDPAPAGGDTMAPAAPAGGDKMSGSMGKKHMSKKHMSKKHMKKM